MSAIVHHCAGEADGDDRQYCLRCHVLLSDGEAGYFDEYRLVVETAEGVRAPLGRPHPSVSEEGRRLLEAHFGDMVRQTLCGVH